MKNGSSSARIRLIATILCALLLLCLFVFPHRRLSAMCDGIEACAKDAVEAVIAKDWARAAENSSAMVALYEQDRTFLHLLLCHTCVEELESSLYGIVRLIQVQDQPQTLHLLEVVVTHARFLKSIEDPRLLTLI